MPEQDAPQQRPTEPPRALLPEFLHQGGASQKLAPEQRKQLVASGGTSRLESVNYGDAILTDNWPRDGLLLARSTVAEKIVVEQYKIDRLKILEENTCQQWWPARAIAVEEYLEYYASTPARFRPKVDAVAVVFLNPWWSAEVKDNAGESRMFELEAVEAKATHARPLPASYEPPDAPQPIKEAVATAHADAVALASALKQFAAKHIDPIESGDAWPRRAARLKAAFEATKPAPRERRQGPPGDVSTAHLDVACYPPHVLQLPWRKVVDAARARGRSLDLDDLPVLTQRPELQRCVDGVVAMPRRLDAVYASREGAAAVSQRCSFHAGALLLDLQQASSGVRATTKDAGGLGRAGRHVAEERWRKEVARAGAAIGAAGSTTRARGLRGEGVLV